MLGNFAQALEVGKLAESYAEKYFAKHNISYQDVRDNPEYQRIDVDYVTSVGKIEVKQNLHEAAKYHPGKFFWIETEVGNNQGWWHFNDTDYFLFFNDTGNGILLKNDDTFKNFINNLITNGDHSDYAFNRFDYKKDSRYNGYITAKSMRVYLEQLDSSGIDIQRLIKRKPTN